MADEDYAVLLEKAKRERAEVGVERALLTRRMEQLDAIIMALRTLVERPKVDPARGITEGVKTALMSALPQGMFPITIRAHLEKAGFDFSKQVNVMASIHAIVKRLHKKGLVRAILGQADQRGTTYYVWSGGGVVGSVAATTPKPEQKEKK